MRPRACSFATAGAFLLCLVGRAHATDPIERPPAPAVSRSSAGALEDGALDARAHAIFDRLRTLSPVAGPNPSLEVTSGRLPKAKAGEGTVSVSRSLLRVCERTAAGPGRRPDEARDACIAFVLAHELEHLARRDAGSFGSREASDAVEKDADEKAVGRMVFAGFDAALLRVATLFAEISRESARSVPSQQARSRRRCVARAIREADRHARDWQLGWLLAVAGRFDQAIGFYARVAWKYPYPTPMYALAFTRLHKAWRVHPCTDPTVVEWLPPLRHDPRALVEPVRVRSVLDACTPFREALEEAATELEQAGAYGPAQVALSAVRLIQGRPSLDPTRSAGGVTVVGGACSPRAPSEGSDVTDDACHVSLLAQYELSGRSPDARVAAIAGLQRLRERSPEDPSLRFNLARLLSHAEQVQEAVPLWRAFLDAGGSGPYRGEAERALSRALPAGPESLGTDALPTGRPSPVADRLAPSTGRCLQPWVSLSSLPSLSYCGSWHDEIVLRNREGNIIRSIVAGSRAWLDPAPPAIPPLHSVTYAPGEELRIWDDEAWLFAGKTPLRIVYFTRSR